MTVSAKQYAEMLSISPSSVTKKMKSLKDAGKQVRLPGVYRIEKWGNTWRFTLKDVNNLEMLKKNFKNLLVNSN